MLSDGFFKNAQDYYYQSGKEMLRSRLSPVRGCIQEGFQTEDWHENILEKDCQQRIVTRKRIFMRRIASRENLQDVEAEDRRRKFMRTIATSEYRGHLQEGFPPDNIYEKDCHQRIFQRWIDNKGKEGYLR